MHFPTKNRILCLLLISSWQYLVKEKYMVQRHGPIFLEHESGSQQSGQSMTLHILAY